MLIGQWFHEGAAAQSAGDHRGSCPYPDTEARSEWLDGFDEAGRFHAVATPAEAKGTSEKPDERSE